MTPMIQNDSAAIPQKLTEAQIEADCPDRLKQIGHEIGVRLKKADKLTDSAQKHLTSVERLLDEAKGLCDDGGYKKFRELFCPQLGKSQAYALLAIAAGKKTLIEHRADASERQRRSRAQRAALADADSVTVTENSKSHDESVDRVSPDQALDGDGTASASTEADLEAQQLPFAWRHGVSPADEAMRRFDTAACELLKVTKGKASNRFKATPIAVSEIVRLWKYLRDLSNHMQASRPDRREEAGDESVESGSAASISPPAQESQVAA